ncbi:hypothetical protein J0H58_21765 [bacterium]|nr:hypothetical protein [bacterium]
MQLKTAISLLSRFGAVRRHRGKYRARVGHGTITFRDEGGRTRQLRVLRGGHSSSCRTVTSALRVALHEVRLLAAQNGVVSVRIERVGRSLVPVAGFIVTTIEERGRLRVEWDEGSWTDEEALRTAQGAIHGTVPLALLLKWLVRRSANIASFLRRLEAEQQSESGDMPSVVSASS